MNSPAADGVFVTVLAMLPIPIFAALYEAIFGEGFTDGIYVFFNLGFFVVIISLGVSALLGTPIYYALRYFKKAYWQLLVIIGACLGALTGLWLFPFGDKMIMSILFGVLGAYGALSYWYGAEKLNANK